MGMGMRIEREGMGWTDRQINPPPLLLGCCWELGQMTKGRGKDGWPSAISITYIINSINNPQKYVLPLLISSSSFCDLCAVYKVNPNIKYPIIKKTIISLCCCC
jgi:hypothetical protein